MRRYNIPFSIQVDCLIQHGLARIPVLNPNHPFIPETDCHMHQIHPFHSLTRPCKLMVEPNIIEEPRRTSARSRKCSPTTAMTHGLFTINGEVGLAQQMYYISVDINLASGYNYVRKSFLRKRWLRLRQSLESGTDLDDANS